ncbi:MAG: DUF2809 domain-containing protein [candidate division KSB1 bacterium]|nr:DUF2809 domain-containing protein [candidate division KSB1 bacterium]
MPSDWNTPERRQLFCHILLLIPVGLAAKFGLAGWGLRYGGAIFYEMFWILFLRFFLPQWSPLRCAVTVFFATSLLEMLQLWHPIWLEGLRSHFLGRILLGTSFDPVDFGYYFVGSAAGFGYLRRLVKS